MAIALATAVVGQNNTGSSILTLATPAFAAVAGSCIAVFCQWGNITNVVSSVTDTALNTYVAQTAQIRSDNFATGQWWVAKNITGNAANIVLMTLNGVVAYDTVHALQYSGVDLTTPVDVSNAGANGTGSTLTSASFTTTTADEVLIAGGNASGFITFTAGSGYTKETQDSGPTSATEDKIVSAIQTGVTAVLTQSGSGAWLIAVLTLKQASAAGTPPTPYYYRMAGMGNV